MMQPLRTITIVGGGTSGWLAAAMLSCHLRRDLYRIQLVESRELGTIGIGESTVPPFVGLIRRLGIDERDFIRATQATYKLGIRFVDWRKARDEYFHPFGVLGRRIGNHDFYQCWLRAKALGDTSSLQDFSPCNLMAENGRFFLPEQARNTPIGGASYALHVDATEVAKYMRRYAEARGVVRTEGRVTGVTRDSRGFVDKLHLANGGELDGDFFIDCTGFKALLIGESLKGEFVDWSNYLPCDRAVALKTAAAKPTAPYTLARARRAGWSWQIPLRHRLGHGYVYASEFCSDAEARAQLQNSLQANPLEEPRTIRFRTGHYREIWTGNCLALGLAAGFVEPLESTSIHLIARGMEFFLRHFPDADCEPALAREYNRRMVADFEEVRDFIMLHYCTSSRTDSLFWRHCRAIPLPDSLRERMELFQAQGGLREGVDDLFRATSWQSVFEGMGIRPRRHCPRVENLDAAELRENLARAREAIAGMVRRLPAYDDFLTEV